LGSIKKQPGSVNFQNSLTIKDLRLDVSCYFWLLWRSKYKQEGTGKDGWKFFAYLNRFLMEQSQNVSIFYRLSMHEAMITCLTSYFERDFTPLFDHWGIEISDAKRIEALEYRPVEKKVWEYNLLEDNETADFDGKVFYTQSGRIPFRHLRREWTAAAYSGEGENLKASNYSFAYSNKVKKYDTPYNLFDGDRQTLWSSYSDPYEEYTDENGDKHYPYKIDNLYYNATTPEFPYFIVVQPGEQAIDMDGVYLALGNTEVSGIYNGDVKDYDKFAFRPQHIIVEVTNTPLEYNDVDTLYTNIQSIAWKKIRMMIPKGQTCNNSGRTAAICFILNSNKKKRMLQEFV